MKKTLSSILSVVLCCSLVAMETACSSSAALAAVNEIAVLVPAVTNAVNGVLIFTDPQTAAIVGDVGAAVQTDLKTLTAAIATYQADQSSGNYTKLGSIIDSMLNAVNAQVLAENHVVNTDSQKIAFAALTALATVLAVIDAKYTFGQPKAAQTAHAAAHTATLRQMEPFLQRDVLAAAANDSGVSYSQAREYLLARGF